MTGKKQQCTYTGCVEKPVARRLCPKHYQAAWKAGELGAHVTLPPRVKDWKICPPEHKHGESGTCYVHHQCRCADCRAAVTARETRRRKDKAYGRYDTGLVDVTEVREHVLMLGEFGIGYKRVAMLAGYRSSTPVRTIIWGRQDPGPRYGEMQKRVKRETAERILAIQPVLENLAPGQSIPATGTHRRIQALAVAGWSLTKIGTRIGMSPSNLITMMHRSQVQVSTRLTVRDLFDELWDQEPPRADWHDKSAYTRTKRFAKAHGWMPALAWDDIDADAEPELEEPSEQTKGERILEDVEWLLESGESAEQIATTLERSADSIAKLAERHTRVDLARPFYGLTKRAAA